MSVINSQPLIGASGNQSTAYNLTRSLRFRSSASAYLNRTVGSPTSQNKWTYSKWVKRGSLGISGNLLSDTSAGSQVQYLFTSSDTLQFYVENSLNVFVTTQVFRDVSSWYHIVLAVDAAASGAAKVKLYVNGSQVTAFSTDGRSSFSQSQINKNGATNTIGNYGAGTNYFDGYLAEVNFVDGQQLDASSFGETDTATGVWIPKKYTGTYGTNGFYLKFDNLTSTSTLGNDSSGNSNTWTVNNISLTSGSTYDSMKDVPTLTDADTANYAVLNAVNTGRALSNGNLNYAGAASGISLGTIAVSSGKWYWETVLTGAGGSMTGIATATTVGSLSYVGANTNSYGYYTSGEKYTNGSGSAYGASWTTNDVIGVALDMDAGTLTFYKNNASQGTAYSSLTGSFVPAVGNNSTNDVGFVNFGQRPFAYTPPSGFKALNTYNLPDSTIVAGNKVMDALTYAGASGTQTVSGLNFQPDLVWVKVRSAGVSHGLFDSVRGYGSSKGLASNLTQAEGSVSSQYGYVSTNTSSGFTLAAGTDGSLPNWAVNQSGETYVGWCWKANGSGSSNTSGSITSTVSVNASAGFSIVTYTGTGSAATVGHGLGVAPKMIIVKSRDQGTTGYTGNWYVYHASNTAAPETDYLLLNTTAATADDTFWNDTAPTSTVFSIGALSGTNDSSDKFVAYCFAEVAGYSAFGSYTGNGSTDGTFVYTGFRPKLIITKASSTTGNWNIIDTARNTTNVIGELLYADASDAGATYTLADSLSNGFKLRNSGGNINNSGTTFIYIAFAENPFKYSLAR
jgi:hypothetical protein